MSTPTDIKTLDTAQRGHHPDSPSGLQSSEACPGFQNEQRTSQAADDGVLQHKAYETRDLSILDGDEEMELAVQDMIAYEDTVVGKYRLNNEPFRIVRESYLHVGDETVVDDGNRQWLGITGGSPDTEIIAQKRADILDAKFGRVPVTPTKDNLQAKSYVLGRFQKSPELEQITFHFRLPYQKWSPEEHERRFVHTFYRREIPALELHVRTVIARKKQCIAQIVANEWSLCRPKHELCVWCARKADCPKVGAIIETGVSKYHDLVVPEEVKEYRLDTTERVAQAYRFANQLQTICKSVKKRCVDAAVTEGLLPPGFSIVKSSRREVTSVRKFVETAIDAGLSEDEAVELLNVPITSFEKAIKEKAPKGTGAPKVRAFAAALEEAGATKDGRPFYFLREQKSPSEKSESIVNV
jgi:hypothetical protein